MTEEQAIRLALAAAVVDGQREKVPRNQISVFLERAGTRGRTRGCWVVGLPLDVPVGFEPSRFFVEVYKDTSEVFVPPIL